MRTPTRDRIERSARRALIVWIGALALFVPTAAHAISYGAPDDGEHPNVGSLVMMYDPTAGSDDDAFPVQLCTGTLVSPRVVLTASHCVDSGGLPAEYVGEPWFTLDPDIDRDKDWVVDPTVTRLTGTAHAHPLYATSSNYRYDAAVFVLDAPVQGVTPATLAPIGVLDAKDARGTWFEAVGYGIRRDEKTTSTAAFMAPGERRKVMQPLRTVTRDFATFSMNLARGHGGTCYGDSGGPHFDAQGRIVATTTTGDIPCKATDKTYRTDTTIVHTFLADWGVPIP